MALIPCRECGVQVSDTAKTCPQCGARPHRRTTTSTKFWGAIFALIVAAMVLSPKRDEPVRQDTPEQAGAKEAARARFNKTAAVVSALKASLRDPRSAEWDAIRANADGTVVCMRYRAKNGFGGLNLEQATYANGKLNTDAEHWNDNCAGKTLYDMKSVLQAI